MGRPKSVQATGSRQADPRATAAASGSSKATRQRRSSLLHYVLKTKRLTGWVLLALIPLFVLTGYALSGKYGIDSWIDPQTALGVHKIFDGPLILVFLLHAVTAIYFALRRWGWIKNVKATPRTSLKPAR